MLQPSYEIFLDTAIRAISLRELVGAVRPVESLRVSRGFQERLHAWALAQLERRDATSTQQLLQFLTRWLVKLCTAEQVVTWWLRAVDAVNSWSFLLASLPVASAASGCDERLHALDRLARAVPAALAGSHPNSSRRFLFSFFELSVLMSSNLSKTT